MVMSQIYCGLQFYCYCCRYASWYAWYVASYGRCNGQSQTTCQRSKSRTGTKKVSKNGFYTLQYFQ